jgi:transposase
VPRTRPPYPPEFRREAIELVRISSKSQHQIAEDLGISDVTLRNWVEPGIPGSDPLSGLPDYVDRGRSARRMPGLLMARVRIILRA